jgi:hypothetical protein
MPDMTHPKRSTGSPDAFFPREGGTRKPAPKSAAMPFTSADLQALADRLSVAGTAPRIVADRDLRRDLRRGAAAIRVLVSRVDALAAVADRPEYLLSNATFEIDGGDAS